MIIKAVLPVVVMVVLFVLFGIGLLYSKGTSVFIIILWNSKEHSRTIQESSGVGFSKSSDAGVRDILRTAV